MDEYRDVLWNTVSEQQFRLMQLCIRIEKLEKVGDKMDKMIRKIEKENKKEGRALKSLEKADKKRDKVCDYGAKMLKMKKAKKK